MGNVKTGFSYIHTDVLEYLFHSFKACFSATCKFGIGDEIASERSEDEIIQYHVLAINTQKQSFYTAAFVEPVHRAFEFAVFETLLCCGQKVPFTHLKFEFTYSDVLRYSL